MQEMVLIRASEWAKSSLFCFDDYTSPFASLKEGNVIRGSSARRKSILVVFLFCPSLLTIMITIMAHVANDDPS